MEIIETATREKTQVNYTPTIKDNALNWFNIESQKSVTNNTTIWNNTPFANQGITGVYNTLTPLTKSSYVVIDQQKVEPILMKMIQASNGEERHVMYIIGNRQLKCMQENGTIRGTAKSPISAYNVKGLCGRRTQNFSKLITETYTDEHDNTRYYWEDYGEFTNEGFKWSAKKLLDEFYIKVADELADVYIYTPITTFPLHQVSTSYTYTGNIHTKFSGKTMRITSVTLISTYQPYMFLNIYNTKEWDFGNNITLTAINFPYEFEMGVGPSTLCLLKYGANINSLTKDDFLGTCAVVLEEEGYKKIGNQNTPIPHIKWESNVYYALISMQDLYDLCIGEDLTGEESTSFSLLDYTPFYIYRITDYLPDIDILQLLRIYQFALNQDITIDESTLQTSIIPMPTQMRYYPIISYTQKFDTFGKFKAKKNLIKIEGDDNYEETTILDVNLSNANVVELEDTAEIATLPSRAYYPDINVNTHTTKTFTRCYEVVISINYADFKNNLSYISFFGQKARVLSGQYDNETQTAKLIILI